eukprot:366430-Chlamydomonas_euryale.AAC.9
MLPGSSGSSSSIPSSMTVHAPVIASACWLSAACFDAVRTDFMVLKMESFMELKMETSVPAQGRSTH